MWRGSKFPAPATMETWVTDQDGDPVFMVVAEPSDSLAGELRRLLPQLRQVVGQGRRVTVCFDRGGWSPALFADITAAGFDVLTWRKGPAPDLPAEVFTTVTCTDDRGRAHEYELADTTVELGIGEGPRKGQTVTLRQVTRLVPAKAGRHPADPRPTSRTGLPAGEVCWRLSSRWREENYFRYARTRFALDALDSYAAAPDDPDRMVPNPARKTAAARVRQADADARAAETARDAALLQLRSPAPGQAAYLSNQVINALAAPVEAAYQELEQADQAAAAVPARIPLADLAPDMVLLDAETKQITHAIRMAAYNAETTLARALAGHYARAGDEAYALIREALTVSGDTAQATANCSSASTRSPRRGAPRPSPRSATSSPPPAPAIPTPISSCATRSNPAQALHKRSLYVGSPGPRLPFTYPPIAAVLLSPLSVVPMAVASTVLTLGTIALLGVVFRVFLRRLAGPGGGSLWQLAWLMPAALFLEPVRNTLGFGQINIVLIAMMSLDCLTVAPRWPRGALTGLAAAVKLTPAVFVLFFLLRRDYKAAGTTAASFAAATGVGFLLAWHDSIRYWTDTVLRPGRIGGLSYASNQCLLAVLARAGLHPQTAAATAAWAALSAVVLPVACRGMRRALAASEDCWALSLNAFAALLISPVSWSAPLGVERSGHADPRCPRPPVSPPAGAGDRHYRLCCLRRGPAMVVPEGGKPGTPLGGLAAGHRKLVRAVRGSRPALVRIRQAHELGTMWSPPSSGPAPEQALISLTVLNGLRVCEAASADIKAPGVRRGHRTLIITPARAAKVPQVGLRLRTRPHPTRVHQSERRRPRPLHRHTAK